MAYFGGEAYYEGEANKVPQLSHSDFAIDDESDSVDDKDSAPIIEFLKSIESKYREQIDERDGKYDKRIVNELFGLVYDKFRKDFSGMLIFDEITAFFDLDSTKFFKMLINPYKNMLFKALKENVNLDTFIRIKKKEQIEQTNGAYQPTFRRM